MLDEDGYLRLTGRLKELINRGGEKISPLEVDDGADGPSGRRAGGDLRHAARRCWARRSPPPWCCARARRRRSASCATSRPSALADFKVPRKIVFLTEIPRARPASCSASAWPRSSASPAMRIAHLRRRRDRRAARRQARAGRRGRHLHRPRPASRGDAGERRDAASAAARRSPCTRAASPMPPRRARRTMSSSR